MKLPFDWQILLQIKFASTASSVTETSLPIPGVFFQISKMPRAVLRPLPSLLSLDIPLLVGRVNGNFFCFIYFLMKLRNSKCSLHKCQQDHQMYWQLSEGLFMLLTGRVHQAELYLLRSPFITPFNLLSSFIIVGNAETLMDKM